MHARRHKNTNGTDTLVATGDGPRPANPPLPYGGRLGPYRLLCGVGTGSWSQVFQAVHAHSGHSQAIKLLRTQSRGDAAADPEACENTQPDAQAHAPADRPTASPGLSLLEQEADVARQVRHPNLVAVHEAHLQSPPYYIALEWIDGCGLDQWIEAQGKLPVPIALWLAR
ncbi:MAG: hypothetical protein HY000_33565, partial [Planctomycetes bacterium]|nr:hypothetical protein [Planctomycetota bacterium]